MVLVEDVRKDYRRLQSSQDLDPLLERIGDSNYVLLGEASHGTHEYYTWRIALTKRLIEEKGFSFIAVEGDWPDCYRLNRFIKGYRDAGNKTLDVLKEFNRWPTWMWANWEIAALAEWMREYNSEQSDNKKVGFYGLDVYSLWESMEVMVKYLRKEDPDAASLVIQAIRCFEPYEEGQDYAQAMLRLSSNCTDEVINLLQEVREKAHRYDRDREAPLNTEMNAQVIANAEKYYRSMVSFNDNSWNIRDTHMMSTLNALMRFHGKNAKAIVWAHNTHVGDARYTDMRKDGMFNVGQLARQQHEKEGVYIVGFASYQGSVIAASSWGAPMQKMTLPSAIEGSIEHIVHSDSAEDKLVLFENDHALTRFNHYLGHRAVGVVYHPEYERGNYVPTMLPSRYDSLIYLDETRALHPLHLKPSGHQMPETYPFGF
ncbi:MAG TPA: erythromycin esterase family protein [Ohtaekwangia sp.]|nr:erythromycin esterase family protein [Ohtaekwangia sp.]